MALSGQYTTYLERSIDASISIPCDIQRLLSTIKDLDESVEVLRAQVQSQCEHICQQPSAAARQATAEQIEHVANLREKMEKDQKYLTFLSNEKISVTNQALNLIGSHVKRMDAEVEVFKDELATLEPTIQFSDLEGPENGGQYGEEQSLFGGEMDQYMMQPPPSAQPRPPRRVPNLQIDAPSSEPPRKMQRTGSSLSEGGALTPAAGGLRSARTPNSQSFKEEDPPAQKAPGGSGLKGGGGGAAGRCQPGDQVAACVSSAETDELEWIMGTVARWVSHSNCYEVRDEEAGEGDLQSHMLPAERVILLPKSAHSRDNHAVLQPGAEVLAVYPGTTTFYKATIIAAARRHKTGEYGDYLLEFEDDGDVGGLPQRPAAFRHVVPYPEGF